MAGTTPMRTLEDFSEVFEVDTSGTDSVDVWEIPKGTIIKMVLAEVVVAGVGASGGNLTVGDDDDGDGFIVAANLCGATVGTIYGDSASERGAYLNSQVPCHTVNWKVYSTAGKEIKIDCSAALTTEATVRIFVYGTRYIPAS